jgi:hypothetical protein
MFFMANLGPNGHRASVMQSPVKSISPRLAAGRSRWLDDNLSPPVSNPQPVEAPPQPDPRRSRQALLAIGAAATVLVVVLLLAFRGDGPGGFPGDDEIASAVRASRKIEAANFDRLGMPAGKVGDWLLTKGFEGYRVPEGLDKVQVEGGALTEQAGVSIAVLALAEAGKRVSIFAAEPLHIKLEPEGSWMVYDLPAGEGASRLAVAAQVEKGVCVVISSPNEPADLRKWLEGRGLRLR